jgi:hypothetical protein
MVVNNSDVVHGARQPFIRYKWNFHTKWKFRKHTVFLGLFLCSQKRIKHGLSLGLKLNPNSTFLFFLFFTPKVWVGKIHALKNIYFGGQIKVLFGTEKGYKPKVPLFPSANTRFCHAKTQRKIWLVWDVCFFVGNCWNKPKFLRYFSWTTTSCLWIEKRYHIFVSLLQFQK